MRKANWGAASGPRMGAQSCTGCAQRMRGGLARPGWPHWLHGDRREEASRRWTAARAFEGAPSRASAGRRGGRPCPQQWAQRHWAFAVEGQWHQGPRVHGHTESQGSRLGSPRRGAQGSPPMARRPSSPSSYPGSRGEVRGTEMKRWPPQPRPVAPGLVALVGAVTFMQVCIPC